MKAFSLHWKGSKKARKQKKYQSNAPNHIRRSFLSAPLSKELRKEQGTRSMSVRKEDSVEILRGEHKGKKGKISHVNVMKGIINVEGVERVKQDGSKIPVPIHPSNVRITTLTKDKRRGKQHEKSS